MKNIKKGRCVHSMNYDKIIDLDNLTLQDCINMYEFENIYTIINDGLIVGLKKE